MVGRGHNRVIQSCAAAGIDLLQRLFELQQVIGEILIEILLVVEVHHKHFVLGIAGAHQIQRSLVHLGALLAHGAGIINEDAHGDRNVDVVKGNDVLRLAIFVNRERTFVESGNDVLMIVNDGGMQHDLVHVFFEDEDALVIELVVLIILLVRARFVGGGWGRGFRLIRRRRLRCGAQRPEETEKKTENPGGPIRQERSIQSSHTP